MELGDPIAELYLQYSGDVRAYLFSLCRDREAAEDLLQTTFLQAMQGLAGFRGESALRTWLFAIARNAYFRWRKKNPETVAFDDAQLGPGEHCGVPAEEAYLQREKLRFAADFLNALEEPTRQLMYLRLATGMTYAEIAPLLGRTEVWARVTFLRVKSRLLQAYKEELP